MKMASENREVGVDINLFPVVVRSIPNTFRKYKTRHYSGIEFMSREQRENCHTQSAMTHKIKKNVNFTRQTNRPVLHPSQSEGERTNEAEADIFCPPERLMVR
ncbi:hypothetical protein SJI19_09640 [Acerihabitans sp. TG2]|uniref:hypothetical protein n=1 Tax=Acerihabitans sp. TG2 TaxID=3096008 RepID=UPI002B236C5E|nr:hypothetical protein [Acerihabitans sp. TG2]MEA9390801.1 hypothetical protein [Acerihabitans sp. TG2]